MSKTFHKLKISQVITETENSKSFYFDIPTSLKDNYAFKAGQYLTLKVHLNGEEVRRAYSICTAPHESKLAVNVKRVKKGLLSNHLSDNFKTGDEVDVMTPDGTFIYNPLNEKSRHFYFFAAGSGITPIMSIIKTILEEEPKSVCHLLYGNRDENNIIFNNALDEIIKKYSGQVFIDHTLSNPLREKESGLKGLFSRGKVSWTGQAGRIDEAKINAFLAKYPTDNRESHYYICGPGAMIDTVVDHLSKRGIAKDFIHTERFISAYQAATAQSGGGTDCQLTFHLQGQTHTITVPSDKTVLDAIVAAKYDAPYSCTSGACSTCLAKTIKGSVKMDVCYALDDKEVAAGYILTCQSRALTSELEISFES